MLLLLFTHFQNQKISDISKQHTIIRLDSLILYFLQQIFMVEKLIYNEFRIAFLYTYFVDYIIISYLIAVTTV